MKPANYAPVYAAALYPQWAEIAREHGYALAVHGSLARDFDLIAVPWSDDPKPPQEFVDAITKRFAAKEIAGPPSKKAHGRLAYTLSIGFGECFADLSFMPAQPPQPAPSLRCETVIITEQQRQGLMAKGVSHIPGRVPQPAPQASEPLATDALETIIDYVDNYALYQDEGTYTPSAREAFLIKDAIIGLLADDAWDAEWGRLINARATLAAQQTADSRTCTCHPADNPPQPCPRKFALSECRTTAVLVEAKDLREWRDAMLEMAGDINGFGPVDYPKEIAAIASIERTMEQK
jgi:hypothetical protein